MPRPPLLRRRSGAYRDDPLGNKAIALHQRHQQALGCPFVAALLQYFFENGAMLIDRAPEPELLSSAFHNEASGAGEFHPHALSEPDVILSHHPAPIVRPYHRMEAIDAWKTASGTA